jgi:hypothetical protein
VSNEAVHEPVMVAEVLEWLAPSRGGVFVDCTVGLGGHTRALLEAGATRVIGLDRDPAALIQAQRALDALEGRVELVHSDYRALEQVLAARNLDRVDGVLADLGVSSMQLDAPGRGFSFRRDEPLDMRMDTTAGPTAAERRRKRARRCHLRIRRGAPFPPHRARHRPRARRGNDRHDGHARRHRAARDPAQGVLENRSRDADVSSDPHLGEP